MAKDITIRVTGQNPDGTVNVQQVDGNNPFMPQSTPSTAMVPYGAPSATLFAPQGGYRAKINGMDVTFASEADYLKADRALREMMEQQNVPMVGGLLPRGGGGGGNTPTQWLRTGASAAEAIGGFLHDRGIRRKLEDLNKALDDSSEARRDLDALDTHAMLGPLIPVLRRLFNAERDATEAALGALEDQLTAVDIQTGAGVAKVAADLIGNRTLDSGTGTALALGGAGLGLGLLMSREQTSRRRR